MYRFIKGAADATLFGASGNTLLQQGAGAAELCKHLEAEGITISRQITSAREYAAILGRQKEFLHRNKSLQVDAARFAICRAGKQMRFLGDLAYVLQHRTRLLNHLKKMLVTTLLRDKIHIAAKPDRRDNHTIIDTIRGLHTLAADKAILKQGRIHARTLHDTYRHLATEYRAACERRDNLEREADKITAAQEADDETWRAEEARLQETGQAKNEEMALVQIETRLQNLEAQAEKYRQQDMESRARESEALPQYRRDAENARIHYEFLQASQADIIRDYEKHTNHIRRHRSERDKELRQRRADEQKSYDRPTNAPQTT